MVNRRRFVYLLRSLHTGVAVLIPAIAGFCLGVVVALITGSRRRGLNVLTRFLGSFGAWMAGMKVTLSGRPAPGFQGPAIVIFNHQSGLDPIILCRVMRANIIGIAKKELRFNPVLGPLLWFAETIFIDRFAQTQNRAAFLPALKALQRGMIIAIAPEGRRQSAEPLATFHTGAFRLALEAGVPVIPIVIHDAARLLAPHRTDLHPGTVHVEILPAIEGAQWQGKAASAMAEWAHSQMRAALCAGPSH